MNELDELERQVLRRARRAMSPTRADAERVLMATQAALMAQPLVSVQAPARLFRAPASLPRKLLAALCIAGVSGSIGYLAGHQAGQAERQPVEAAAESAGPALEVFPVVKETSDEARVALPSPARGVTRRRAAREAAGHDSPEQAPAAPQKLSFADELAAVKSIERALRNGEPHVALELLDDLDERMPEGALLEERMAASTMARCALGLGARSTLRNEFANQHPSSAYLERVARACVPHDRAAP